MTPAAIIGQATADGLTLGLTPAGTIKAIGQGDAVTRWLPILREHKRAIVAALQDASNDPGTHYRWRVTFNDRPPLEVCFLPELCAAEVIAQYPGATVEPMPDFESLAPAPELDAATPAEAANDRRTCRQCANLTPSWRDGFRRCAAARRGVRIGNAGRDYSPMPVVPRRCEGYAPGPDDD